ncbi:ABC transporter ATP-binding protein [Dickeya oryzae]|uniref:ABC transporter ATP-binding protein n=1 Tax=Dickeya oryzae TaxID=1240404 RepID=UPI002096F366|nr:ABC transporter ATP-binding protein [Dickeya oryzae]MCO7253980.1 ABC transporter ATP-binding protein [Dickeya oryzae]
MGEIIVENLGKAYKKYPSKWARLTEWVLPGRRLHHSLKWILKDINFTVNEGEAVGLIGLNGAGKSTLLKIITGTTLATTGRVTMKGRVAALLELGMGFHPDFTGRQNAIMGGQLLGLSVDEINILMPEIEAFAEIGEYIDQPVRVYSSGMQMRLAFSVATAVRPDILIVDEALSVGDAYFVHKSFGRIREFREKGTTLLIVSHDKAAIQAICDRAILLNNGSIAMIGAPESVLDYYNALLSDNEGSSVRQIVRDDGYLETTSGTGEARIIDCWLQSMNGERLEIIRVGQLIQLRIEIECIENIDSLVAGFSIKNRFGQDIFGTNTFHSGHTISNISAGKKVEVSFEFPTNIGDGNYSISIALHADSTHVNKSYEWRDIAIVFTVVNVNLPAFVGSSWLPTNVSVFNER